MDIRMMIGKEVEVTANGMKYVGVLIEVSDEETHLKAPFQWITLSTASIAAMRLKDGPAAGTLEPWDEGGHTTE